MKRRAFVALTGAAAVGVTAAEAKSRCPQPDERMWFEMYQDEPGQWRWRLFAGNGKQIAAPGEGYATRPACEEAVNLIKRCWAAKIKA